MFLFQESSLTLKPGHHGWASVLTTHQLKAYEEVFLSQSTKGQDSYQFLGWRFAQSSFPSLSLQTGWDGLLLLCSACVHEQTMIVELLGMLY
jgi:hypothetical protein